MKFEEIFKNPGLYIADGFIRGFVYRITIDGILECLQYNKENHLFPSRVDVFVYAGLFEKNFRQVYNISELFK